MDFAFPLEFEFSPEDIGLDCRLGILCFLAATNRLPFSSAIHIEVYVPFLPDLINAHDISSLPIAWQPL
jgi:hypothetical protein